MWRTVRRTVCTTQAVQEPLQPLGTTDFDELVSKSREMYPADVWVCTLRNNVLQRVVAGRPTVSARSTRYFVEIKAGYHTYHLDWAWETCLKLLSGRRTHALLTHRTRTTSSKA